MKFDINKPFKTRDGCVAVILKSDLNNEHYPMAGYVTTPEGVEQSKSWTKEGRWLSDTAGHRFDLVNVKTKHTIYLNVYLDGILWSHNTERKAFCAAGKSCLSAAQPFTYEV